MDYVDQSADGLRFYLTADDVDVEPFTVISSQCFRWNQRVIDFGILGASHYLKINFGGGQFLTELFACADIETQTASIKSAPFGNLPAKVEVPFAQSIYRFTPRLVSWSEGEAELEELRQDIDRASAQHRTWGLEHQFPSLPGDDETKPPLTLVHVQSKGQLTLRTAHCYPNDEQIVFTTTTLNKEG
jgi:hypothetical protein